VWEIFLLSHLWCFVTSLKNEEILRKNKIADSIRISIAQEEASFSGLNSKKSSM
jgi:hypothetical protein